MQEAANTAEMLCPPGLSVKAEAEPRWHVGTLSYNRRGLARLCGWLLWGDFATSLKDRAVPSVLPLVLGLFNISNTAYAVITGTLPGLLSMFLGPVISYKSDRYRGRWGRRRPFLVLPVPVCALTMFMMGFSPKAGLWLHQILGTHAPGHWLHLTKPGSVPSDSTVLLVFAVSWMFFEACSIVSGSVFGAFINDVVPQAVIGRFYSYWRLLSLAAGVIFMKGLFDKVRTHYAAIFVGLGLLYGIGFTLACLMVEEGNYAPPPPAGRASSPIVAAIKAARDYLRDCFTKPYYYWVFIMGILPGLGFYPVWGFALFFSQSVKVSDRTYANLMTLSLVLSMITAVPVGWLADRLHPLRAALLALLLHAIVVFWGGHYIHNTATFAFGAVTALALQGVWATASASFANRLLPQEKFAQYTSAWGLFGTVFGLPFGPVVGWMLDRTHNTYRYTFTLSGVFDVAAILVTIVVYRQFLKLGGHKSYVAP